MSLLGIHLNVLIGPGSVALPASFKLLEALREVEVKYTEEGRSGFKLVFEAGRTGPTDFMEDPVISDTQLQVKNRVVLTALFGPVPKVVADGIITVVLATPGDVGEPTLVEVAGEDLSILMDLEEKIVEHPAQPSSLVVMKIVGEYAQYGLIPMIIPPTSTTAPNPLEKVPVQRETDLAYINKIKPEDYAFCMEPGPVPLMCTAYFGPKMRTGIPNLNKLRVNMGPDTNCSNMSFQYEPMQATTKEGTIQDSQTNTATTVQSTASPYPSLSAEQPTAGATARKSLLENTPGLTVAEAMAKAQAQSDKSGETLIVTGELDSSTYGDVLQIGTIVTLTGAGLSYDGDFRVKEVSHKITPGSYTQGFTLKREGKGASI